MTSRSNRASVVDSVVSVFRVVSSKGIVLSTVEVLVPNSGLAASDSNVVLVEVCTGKVSRIVCVLKVVVSTALVSLSISSVLSFTVEFVSEVLMLWVDSRVLSESVGVVLTVKVLVEMPSLVKLGFIEFSAEGTIADVSAGIFGCKVASTSLLTPLVVACDINGAWEVDITVDIPTVLSDSNVAVSDVGVSVSGSLVANSGFNVVSLVGFAADVSMVVPNSNVTVPTWSTWSGVLLVIDIGFNGASVVDAFANVFRIISGSEVVLLIVEIRVVVSCSVTLLFDALLV